MSSASADALWAPIVANGSTWCASNVHADATWVEAGGTRWRVSLTRPLRRNSYVVSATGQYLDYAREEVRRIPSAMARGLSHAALLPMAPMLRALDPIVVLDALPVSTVLHGSRDIAEWDQALTAVRAAHPGRPVVIRSLDAIATPALLPALASLGLQLMPSRLVFHQDPRTGDFWRIRNVRHDVTLATSLPMESRRVTLADVPRIAALYWLLYGEKHSTLNPDFSEAWLAHGMTSGVLRGEGLIHDGRLVAAYLSYIVEDVMTNPVFGYDTSLPQQLGLYRRLSVLTMQHAREHGLRLHASSGAPGFKASRGGVPTIEYHAVDLRGAHARQRTAWAAALAVARRIGPRLLRSAT